MVKRASTTCQKMEFIFIEPHTFVTTFLQVTWFQIIHSSERELHKTSSLPGNLNILPSHTCHSILNSSAQLHLLKLQVPFLSEVSPLSLFCFKLSMPFLSIQILYAMFGIFNDSCAFQILKEWFSDSLLFMQSISPSMTLSAFHVGSQIKAVNFPLMPHISVLKYWLSGSHYHNCRIFMSKLLVS